MNNKIYFLIYFPCTIHQFDTHRYMAEKLPFRLKTLFDQSINQFDELYNLLQHKAYFLIQLNAYSLYPFALLIPMLALLAYPDADYPDADPD